MGHKGESHKHIKQLLRTYSGHPEPNRKRLGYHRVNDPLSLLCGVMKHDKPYRNQSWRWIEEVSGIPATTAKRILVDSRHDPNSALHRVARCYGYVFFTKGKPYYSNTQRRKVILNVCKDDSKEE